MSTYKVNTDGELAYADTITIDEAGIDLSIDGEIELGASFEGIDPYALALDVLPEDFDLPEDVTMEFFNQSVGGWLNTYYATESEEKKAEGIQSFEMTARLFLTVLKIIRDNAAAEAAEGTEAA